MLEQSLEERTMRSESQLLVAALLIVAGVLTGACSSTEAPVSSDDSYAVARERMVTDDIASGKFGRKPVQDTQVLRAMRAVARHKFVARGNESMAYADSPLGIGYGQTISQPYIVAAMTELAAVDAEDVVLEVGTGSGYQAAVLAEIVQKVYTVEIVAPLGEEAKARLKSLGYDNVEVRIGDGYAGWPEHAPYDAIVVTAAPETVPQPLIEQLAIGGRMVIPVGGQYGAQALKVVIKQEDGSLLEQSVMPVRFVPFTRSPSSDSE
jgi:protein-L-isoaspartate(D-aspartate) O-methyltransferase